MDRKQIKALILAFSLFLGGLLAWGANHFLNKHLLGTMNEVKLNGAS